MDRLTENVANNIIKYTYDEHENGEYRMYLEDITLGDKSFLFIRADENNDNDVLVYVCNADDSDSHFVAFEHLTNGTKIVIIDQILKKRGAKLDTIKIIKHMYHKGYNIPCNMIVPSIKDKIFFNDPNNKSHVIIGETGLTYDEDDGEMCFVIWYGKVHDEDCIQHWVPLYALSVDEIETIGSCLCKQK